MLLDALQHSNLAFLPLHLSSSMVQNLKVVFIVGNKYYIQSIVSKLQYKLKCIGIAIFNCKLNYKDDYTQITNSLILIAQCCNNWNKFISSMPKSRDSTSCVLILLECPLYDIMPQEVSISVWNSVDRTDFLIPQFCGRMEIFSCPLSNCGRIEKNSTPYMWTDAAIFN